MELDKFLIMMSRMSGENGPNNCHTKRVITDVML